MYAKDPYETKYWNVMKKVEEVGPKDFMNQKLFFEYSCDIDNAYKNINENNPRKNKKY